MKTRLVWALIGAGIFGYMLYSQISFNDIMKFLTPNVIEKPIDPAPPREAPKERMIEPKKAPDEKRSLPPFKEWLKPNPNDEKDEPRERQQNPDPWERSPR